MCNSHWSKWRKKRCSSQDSLAGDGCPDCLVGEENWACIKQSDPLPQCIVHLRMNFKWFKLSSLVLTFFSLTDYEWPKWSYRILKILLITLYTNFRITFLDIGYFWFSTSQNWVGAIHIHFYKCWCCLWHTTCDKPQNSKSSSGD